VPIPHSVNGSRWEELTAEEMRAELDAQSRRLVDLPLDEFVEAYQAGKLDPSPAVDYLALVTGASSTRP
jgi:hypothetical protein